MTRLHTSSASNASQGQEWADGHACYGATPLRAVQAAATSTLKLVQTHVLPGTEHTAALCATVTHARCTLRSIMLEVFGGEQQPFPQVHLVALSILMQQGVHHNEDKRYAHTCYTRSHKRIASDAAISLPKRTTIASKCKFDGPMLACIYFEGTTAPHPASSATCHAMQVVHQATSFTHDLTDGTSSTAIPSNSTHSDRFCLNMAHGVRQHPATQPSALLVSLVFPFHVPNASV